INSVSSIYTLLLPSLIFFFFPPTAPPETYTLSLHDALPISTADLGGMPSVPSKAFIVKVDTTAPAAPVINGLVTSPGFAFNGTRSEEHTSELQSRGHLVCRLLLEKKKKKSKNIDTKNS